MAVLALSVLAVAAAMCFLIFVIADNRESRLTNEEVCRLLDNNFDEVNAVWIELGEAGKPSTLRDAVEEWLRRKKE